MLQRGVPAATGQRSGTIMEPMTQRRQNRMRGALRAEACLGGLVAGNIADYFKAHLATPDLALYRRCSGDTWADVSVADLAQLIGRWQSAFTTLGLVEGDRVALCVKNSVDWIDIDLAALGVGLVVAPLYVAD